MKTGFLLLTPRGVTRTKNPRAASSQIWSELRGIPRDRPLRVAMLIASQEGAPTEEQFELREALPLFQQQGYEVQCYGISQHGDEVRAAILACDVIYLCGGAPYWHLAHFKLLGITKDILSEYLYSGGVVVGSSAGSMVLGTNVSGLCEAGKVAWAKQGPDVGVEYDRFGLGLVEEQMVPHPEGVDAILVRALRFSPLRRAILKSIAKVRVLWDGSVHYIKFPQRVPPPGH